MDITGLIHQILKENAHNSDDFTLFELQIFYLFSVAVIT
jgi:hypothetical protein